MLRKTLMLIAVASMLTACASSTPSSKARIVLPALPANTVTCDKPQALPAGRMSQQNVVKLWSKDRAALVVCRNRHGAVVTFYETLSKNLAEPVK